MLKTLNEHLLPFRSCFSRQATFEWFIAIIVGFMLHSDHLGVTSVIRDLSLRGRCYKTLLHFRRSALLLLIQNRVVLVGDRMKQAKEGIRMSGVKKLHQES